MSPEALILLVVYRSIKFQFQNAYDNKLIIITDMQISFEFIFRNSNYFSDKINGSSGECAT